MSNQSNMSDLWKRLRFVFFAILVYRIGTHIPIPGIDPDRLAALFQQNQGTIIEMFNLFSGGALERMSIFALNVVPYISSAIIMQLFSNSIPYLQELKKDDTNPSFNLTPNLLKNLTKILVPKKINIKRR